MKRLLRGLALTCLSGALAFVSTTSRAETADFATNGPVGNLFTSTFTDPLTGVTAQGLFLSGTTGAWSDANLYRRNDPDDHGFGVCDPREMAVTGTGDCPGPLDAGDVNELDNAGRPELIVLKLPDGFQWVSVQVSSLDTNAAGPTPERGILYADGDGVFSTTLGDVGDNSIRTFTGGVDPVEATFLINPFFATVPFLVFEPFDHTGNAAKNNDFLVYKATVVKKERNGKHGCPSTYWKQSKSNNWWMTERSGGKYGDVFGVKASFSRTLGETLSATGTGEIGLARQASAALLNSLKSDVDFAYSSDAVKSIVRQAYSSRDFNSATRRLKDANERECPMESSTYSGGWDGGGGGGWR